MIALCMYVVFGGGGFGHGIGGAGINGVGGERMTVSID